jgi:uncharacterized delta-60 repeat protein
MTRSLAALVFLAALIAPPASLAQAGSPDPSFGIDGRLVLPLGWETEGSAVAAARQADGRFVVAGWEWGTVKNRCAVGRFGDAGWLDPSFGSAGIAVTTVPGVTGHCLFYAVALEDDGRIVVAGQLRSSTGPAHSRFVVARYNADGALDPSFGGTGVVLTAVIAGGVDVARSVAGLRGQHICASRSSTSWAERCCRSRTARTAPAATRWTSI